MARLMILGAGMIQVPVIEKAKDNGHFVITVDRDINAAGNKFADVALELDSNDFDGILNAAIELKIDGILTTSDLPVKVVAKVCDKLGLSGTNIYASEVCTNKFAMRVHLAKYGFFTPKYKLLEVFDDISEIDFYPAIIKPLDSSGSRGVKKVRNSVELLDAFPMALSYSRAGKVIVEEFIEGKEFSVESLTQNDVTHIIAITEKTVKGKEGIFFVEDRHVIPANLSEQEIILVHQHVLKLIQSLNLGNSASHTELKMNKNGIFIIEIGARLGGDYITSDLVPLACGVDMLQNVINLSLGLPINATITHQKFAGVQFITPLNYAVAIKFIEENKSLMVKYHIQAFKDAELENSIDRLGYLIASKSSREELIRILDFN